MYESKELLLAVILSVVFGSLFAGGFYMKEKFMDWLEKDDGKEEKKTNEKKIKSMDKAAALPGKKKDDMCK